jgi:hypothetical protein
MVKGLTPATISKAIRFSVAVKLTLSTLGGCAAAAYTVKRDLIGPGCGAPRPGL